MAFTAALSALVIFKFATLLSILFPRAVLDNVWVIFESTMFANVLTNFFGLSSPRIDFKLILPLLPNASINAKAPSSANCELVVRALVVTVPPALSTFVSFNDAAVSTASMLPHIKPLSLDSLYDNPSPIFSSVVSPIVDIPANATPPTASTPAARPPVAAVAASARTIVGRALLNPLTKLEKIPSELYTLYFSSHAPSLVFA